jgi:hypothetical protein
LAGASTTALNLRVLEAKLAWIYTVIYGSNRLAGQAVTDGSVLANEECQALTKRIPHTPSVRVSPEDFRIGQLHRVELGFEGETLQTKVFLYWSTLDQQWVLK